LSEGFTADTHAGAFTVLASVSGIGTPASFNLTNTAGTANAISTTAGTPQSATVNTSFANPLIATVVDQFNNPVSGVTVTFTSPATSGASGTFSNNGITISGITNAGGQLAEGITADTHAGAFTVLA